MSFTNVPNHVNRLVGTLAVAGLVALLVIILATAALGDISFLSRPIGEAPRVQRVVAQPTFYRGRTATVTVKIAPKPAHKLAPRISGRCYAEPGTPPASVLQAESGGSPTARNRSGAAGCWQFMPGTWGRYKGYASADQAPIAVQNERAKQVWAGGDGACHWRATTDQC